MRPLLGFKDFIYLIILSDLRLSSLHVGVFSELLFFFVLSRFNGDGFTPLDIAVMLGRPSIIKMLLLHGAQEGTKCKCLAYDCLFVFVYEVHF